MTHRLLIVDDDKNMCEMLCEDLGDRGYEVEWLDKPEKAFDAIMSEQYDTVVADLKMPRLNGIEFCHRLSQNRPDVPVIIITAFGSMDTAIQALRAGAYDFVNKPIELDMLAVVVERAIKQRKLQEQVRLLQEKNENRCAFDEFIGESPCMLKLFDRLERIADQEVPVLITGESGTGKELAAQAIHRRSSRCNESFIPVNCAALSEPLLESELFGHIRGAFTSAHSERKGLFAQASGGTLFLDEIAEIPLRLQPKLLRALETGTVRPLGGDDEVPCDVRIIAATNRDLESLVEDGQFREDLFFRINVVRIEMPPLRSRGTDILFLAQYFLSRIAERSGKALQGFSPAVADKLLAYRWPGNVRELRNAMERAGALTRFEQLAVEDLPGHIRNYNSAQIVLRGENPEELLTLEEIERQYIRHVMDAVDGNKTAAARILGCDRKTLYRKLERLQP